MSPPSVIALIPARRGSLRVKGKNIRPLMGHPLIGYTIAAARNSGIFDRIIVSTDCPETQQIAIDYGAEAPFLRPEAFASAVSIDVEWITHAFDNIDTDFDAFAILRPTSPLRTAATIQRAWKEFLAQDGIDSIRAVELCQQHPGKMWRIEKDRLTPFIPQDEMDVALHAKQYQDLPEVYVQNSSLEIAWKRVIPETNSREGRVIAPFITEGFEGLAIDYEHDWFLCEHLVTTGKATIPTIARPGSTNHA